MKTIKIPRPILWLILIVVLAIHFGLALTSCTTYKRCQAKYANQITDTVKVNVPVSVLVPRDSVVTSFVTDTTYLYKEIQQGRAKVIVERTNTITTVQARCDTVTITKTVEVKVPETKYWGVKPAYKRWFEILRVVCIALFCLNAWQFLNQRSKRNDAHQG